MIMMADGRRRTAEEQMDTRRLFACIRAAWLVRQFSIFNFQFSIFNFLVFSLLAVAASASAADAPQAVWLVSTRDATHCGKLDDAPEAIHYWRLTENCQWASADAKQFQADDDTAVPTVVYIHGNRTDADDAVAAGMGVYQIIRSEGCPRAFRYVIWSWPADRMCRRSRPDAQLKAAYSDVESYYLATWLNNLRPGVKVSLIGHSFGPRIITGAMHLLAGGEVAGNVMPKTAVAAWTAGKRNPVRAVLLAAAVDADALAPDSTHGLALSLFDQVLITCNPCDRALRWYPRLYGRGGPQALGAVGPCGVDSAANLDLVDVSGSVGRRHDWRCYCSAPEVSSQWAHYTFLDDTPAQPQVLPPVEKQ
jgi:hypothetical protein